MALQIIERHQKEIAGSDFKEAKHEIKRNILSNLLASASTPKSTSYTVWL